MHGLKFGRRTIDIIVQSEFSLNVKSKKRLNDDKFSHTRGPISYVSVVAIRY